jgi:hypothetical protein
VSLTIIFALVMCLSALGIDSWSWDQETDFTYGLFRRYDDKGRLYNGPEYYSTACTHEPDINICQGRAAVGIPTFVLSFLALLITFGLFVALQMVRKHKLKEIKWYYSFFALASVALLQCTTYLVWTWNQPETYFTGASAKSTLLSFLVICISLGFSSKSQLMAPN